MADKKGSAFHIGIALLVIGILNLLQTLNILSGFQEWWMPILLILVGIMVVMNRKGLGNILGWILLVYGALALLMTIGVFSLAFLVQIMPATYIIFGLLLLI